jgi:hypothetical protein
VHARAVKPLLGTALALALAGSAGAIESINGTYEGKLRCSENSAGTLAKTKQDLELRIIGDAGIFNVGVFAGGQPYALKAEGPIVEQTAKPDRATIAGIDCDYQDVESRGLAIHAEIAIKPGSEKGTIKGTILRQSGTEGRSIELCTFTAKRTSTALPVVSACPP